ncbi:MAG: nucleoside diphosphate kinase [Chlamydiales bacterium]|jgi:nucleoside-diphosphate kinase|nr:nucleoside diphosphate kinase [Chlamydiales bacterium]
MNLQHLICKTFSSIALLTLTATSAFAVDSKPLAEQAAVPIEKTLTILKPDSLEKHHIGAILAKIEEAGLSISALKMIQLNEEIAKSFYQEHQGKPFFNTLVAYMTRGPIVVAVLEGERAITKTRQLMGATDPRQAQVGTIRKAFATSMTENAMHSSDSLESAAREIDFFFRKAEIFNLKP